MRLLIVFSALALVSQASASVLMRRTVLARQTGPDMLSQIPAACREDCKPIANVLDSCLTNECMCTNEHGSLLKQCIDCLVELGASTNAAEVILQKARNTAFEFVVDCKSDGYPIDSIVIADPAPPTPPTNSSLLPSSSSPSPSQQPTTTSLFPSPSVVTNLPTSSSNVTDSQPSQSLPGRSSSVPRLMDTYRILATMFISTTTVLTLYVMI